MIHFQFSGRLIEAFACHAVHWWGGDTVSFLARQFDITPLHKLKLCDGAVIQKKKPSDSHSQKGSKKQNASLVSSWPGEWMAWRNLLQLMVQHAFSSQIFAATVLLHLKALYHSMHTTLLAGSSQDSCVNVIGTEIPNRQWVFFKSLLSTYTQPEKKN